MAAADDPKRVDALVTIVGAGPTGLAVAHALRRRGVAATILERHAIGATWTRVYPSVRLHTRREAAHLPGLRYPRGDPFPTAADVAAYLRRYAQHFALDVREATPVDAVTPSASGGARWRLDTPHGVWRTRVLVWAAGIFASPHVPDLPGRDAYAGAHFHVAAYRTPEVFRGANVLVIGGGNSGKDVAIDALAVARRVTVAFRTPPVTVAYPNAFTQHGGTLLKRLPPRFVDALLRRIRQPAPGFTWPERSLAEVVPVVGFELLRAIAAGHVAVRGAVIALTPHGARFADGAEEDFDVVVFATGFTPAVAQVAPYLTPDLTPRLPGLLVAGAAYPALGTFLQQLRREAPAVARAALAQMR